MTSVNVTTTKNTVTVNGETRVVTVKTAGPQGPAFANGTYGDIVVSNDGADLNIATGVIVDADISNSAAIDGSKINPTFTQNLNANDGLDVTGIITGTSHLDLPDDATLKLGDNDEFEIFHNSSNSNSIIREIGGGILSIQTNGNQIDFWDYANQVLMAQFATGGACTFRHGATTRLATSSTGIDVTGNIVVSGTVDNRDLAADGSKLDTYEADGGSYLRSDADDSFTGTLTGESDSVNPVIQLNGAGPNFIRFDRGTGPTSDSIDLVYRTSPNTLGFERVSDSQIMFSVDADDQQAIFNGNVDCTSGLDVSGGDITGTLGSGVTGTTQSASDNSTKIATTSYVDTAVSNLVNSAPSQLDTLNEISAALNNDANFSSTIDNLLDGKLSLTGGTLSGNLTILKQNPKIELNDPDASQANYEIRNDNGIFSLSDSTNSTVKLSITSNGNLMTIGPRLKANNGIELPDNDKILIGSNVLGGNNYGHCQIYHTGTNGYINNSTGDFIIQKSNTDRLTVNADGATVNGTIITNESLTINNNAGELYFYDATETNLIGFLRGTKAQGVDKFEIVTSQNNSEMRLVTRANTGQDQLNKMILTADDVRIGATMVNGTADDNDVNAIFKQSGATELYFNGAGVDSTKVFETVSTGVDITGAITATVGAANADILTLTANMGNNNGRFLKFSAPDTDSGSKPFTIATENALEIDVDNQRTLFIDDSGQVNLHHDGSSTAKLSTTATGIKVNPVVTIDGSTPRIEMKVTGDAQSHRLEFYNTADSMVSRIYGDPSTGNLEIQTGASGIETAIKVNSGGAVDLHHDGSSSAKLSTTATGVTVDGQLHINSASYARTMYQSSGTNMWSVGLRASASGDTNYHIFREAGHTGEVEIGAKINANGGLDVTSQIVSKSTTGTGSTGLKIDNSNETFVQYFEGGGADATFVMSYTGSGGTDIRFKHNGEISLNHAGQEKLKTSSTGVAVTGKATMTESAAIADTNLRKITTSTSAPTSSDGGVGDIWIVYPS